MFTYKYPFRRNDLSKLLLTLRCEIGSHLKPHDLLSPFLFFNLYIYFNWRTITVSHNFLNHSCSAATAWCSNKFLLLVIHSGDKHEFSINSWIGKGITMLLIRQKCNVHMTMPSCFGHVQLFATLWTIVHQAPLSMGFFRLEYWSQVPISSSRGSSLLRD